MKRVTLLGVVLLASACGGSSEPTIILNSPAPSPSLTANPTSPATATTSPPAVRRVKPTTRPAETTTKPKPPPPSEPVGTILPETLQGYMLRLEAIEPELSSDEQQALARGSAVCDDVRAGADYDALITYTGRTFTFNGGHPLTEEKAREVYEAVRDAICPT